MERVVEALKEIVGEKNVVYEREKLEDYLRDETYPMLRLKPAANVVVVKPLNAEEVSRILKFANEHRIPVFPRGGGTGLVGGAVPTREGIVLTTERMKGIEIDRENLMATVGAGVTLEELIKASEEAGLFFPLHPGDETAHIGGLAATNAGGVRAVKYGVMRNYVKGLEVVLPTGEILNLGGKLQKDNTGYDLLDLIVGSEGTLAVITKVIVKLHPKPGASATLIAPFNSRHEAVGTVPKILQSGIIPLAIEYAERELMEKAAKHIGEEWPVKEGNCYLLIIVVGENRDQVLYESQKIAEICEQNHSLEILFAEPKHEQEKILRIRSAALPVLEAEGMVDGLDTAVPPAKIGEFLDKIDKIAEKYGTSFPVAGHAGDGNIHVCIMKREGVNLEEYAEKLRHEIYEAALELGGTISAEHGIGGVRLKSLPLYLSEKEIDLMRQIKKVFDPNGILNPGKKIP
ncbi:MAG: FAD-binding oxidoreductase [Candidatus Hecatellales archaeon]|nr:MAG: FAD-binding oxidoreductase [Candidatus Hecatellales archaeon]